ncbi:CDP-alcohol phosphatidyltransferase family protein [Stappia sp. ES.058]|uniref:CDP-alcohol phosphatidyltransferase family protein n=1 Tax=Stappia sp. ES.058 TaxID=1881061 RepID=UPI00087A6CA5|nr:CDP-alcohol phosphatidyltransferase family protein [Stappia sp. ES.058]SDU33646.1 CDP-diacylglycerol--glycerol-3-phosphate 3-phosphatidyltransferase/archaetidylinositol phosphate synthase [Stappia sp. ES.058]
MIDGLFKRHIDPLWESLSTPLIRAGMTPNQVTATGLVLICLASLAYLWHGNPALFGVTLAVSFAFDALDGAVARRRDMCTRSGGYFDAMVDRYQELAVLGAIAAAQNMWGVALFAFSGGVLTSYAKARTAIEIPISNEAWPDFFERLERIIFLCAMLLAAGAAPLAGLSGATVIAGGLALYGVLSHFTAVQRMRRAVRLLRAADSARELHQEDVPE